MLGEIFDMIVLAIKGVAAAEDKGHQDTKLNSLHFYIIFIFTLFLILFIVYQLFQILHYFFIYLLLINYNIYII